MRKRIQTFFLILALAVAALGIAEYTTVNSPFNNTVGQNITTNSTNIVFADHCAEDEENCRASHCVDNPSEYDYCENEESLTNEECEQLGVPILEDSEVCPEDTPGGNIIYSYLALVIELLSAGVGLVITLMIAVSGVQYITARDDPKKIEAAKHKIWNAVLALILFILMYALINFIVPGGVF